MIFFKYSGGSVCARLRASRALPVQIESVAQVLWGCQCVVVGGGRGGHLSPNCAVLDMANSCWVWLTLDSSRSPVLLPSRRASWRRPAQSVTARKPGCVPQPGAHGAHSSATRRESCPRPRSFFLVFLFSARGGSAPRSRVAAA